ncbi:MAG: colicin V synthesis protein [Arcobacter sp.]|nr:MAG: colicin V synthesis protein [Arcobacter sp.]
MQDFTIFDMVIVSITILLGLKGLFRGFIKEVFGLIAIIGGIFVASRMAAEIGNVIAPILALENVATIKLIGFVIGLIGFWAIVYVAGIILSKIFAASGLGLFDRILGFLFGAAKIFLIFSVITYALYQVQSFKELMNKKVSDSIVFPFLVETGGFIVKLDASDFVKKVEEKITPKAEEIEEDPDLIKEKTFVQEVKETVNEIKKTTVDSGTVVVDTVKKAVNENVEKMTNKIEETANKTTNEMSETKATKEEAAKMVEEINKGN